MRLTLAVTVLSIILVCCNEKKQQQTKNETNYEEGFVDVDPGVRIFYQKQGNGPQVTVIPAGYWLYDDFKHLVNDERTFIFYDMRNRGRSDYVNDTLLITIQKDVEDVEKIRQHFNANKINLMGWSYLGMMVMLYANQYPDNVDKIVQLGPVPAKWDTPFPDSLRYASEPELDRGWKYMDSLKSLKLNETEPERFTSIQFDSVVSKMLVGDFSNANKLGKQWRESTKYPNEWDVNFGRHLQHHFGSIMKSSFAIEQFTGINHPVLIIHGTKDRNAPFGGGKEWASRLQNAKLVRINGAAHVPWAEYPDQVFQPIDSFLTEQEKDIK
jgi:proline iminopeptidase